MRRLAPLALLLVCLPAAAQDTPAAEPAPARSKRRGSKEAQAAAA